MGQKRFRHLGRPVLCDRRNTGYVNQQLCLCGVIHSAVLIPEGQVFTNHTNTPYPLNCHKDLFGAMLHSVQSNELKSVNKCFFSLIVMRATLISRSDLSTSHSTDSVRCLNVNSHSFLEAYSLENWETIPHFQVSPAAHKLNMIDEGSALGNNNNLLFHS